MSSHLEKLEKEYKEDINAQRMVAQGLNISAHDSDKVTVYLMSEPDSSVDETALYDIGAQIIKQADNVTKAEIPIDMLTAVADTVNGVSFIKTPDKLFPVAVTSEGVDLTGADTYHNAGYTGSDVKIAVFEYLILSAEDHEPGMVTGPVSMRILGALALGPRERLLLVDVAGTQVLLGVTPTQITRLLEIEEQLALSQQPASNDFAARLRQIIGAGRQA